MKNYADVQVALSQENLEEARELLRTYLQEEPGSAEVWYLAAQAAVNDKQRQHFLEKAVECDPLYAAAGNALHDLLHPGSTPLPPSQPGKIQQSTEYPTLAPLINRAAAFCIDYALLLLISFFLSFVASLITSILTGGQITSETAYQSIFLWGLLSMAAYISYYGFMLSRHAGQTLGKRWMGIRVIKRNGQPFTWWDAFLRCWVGYLLAASPLGIGFFWAIIDPQRRGWHDIITDTLVVEVNSES